MVTATASSASQRTAAKPGAAAMRAAKPGASEETVGWRRETARRALPGCRAGGGAQERDAGGQVATEEAVEERLRLEGDDAGAGGDQGAGAVAGVGADVEGEVARAPTMPA